MKCILSRALSIFGLRTPLAILLALGLAAAGSAPANALLVEADLFAPGDGLLVRDTDNHREWIDLTATTGTSANTALSYYAPLGFAIATSADVIQLFTAAGIPDILVGSPQTDPTDPGTGGTVANRTPVEALLALMNHASPYSATSGNPWLHGYTDYGSNTNLTLSRFAAFTTDTLGRANVNSNGTSWTYDTPHNAIGTYLVRDYAAVPVPASLPLLLGGLGVMAMRRKVRR